MKRLITILLLVSSVQCFGQSNTVVPISQFPLASSPGTNWLFVLANPNIGNFKWPLLAASSYFGGSSGGSSNYYTNNYYYTNWYTNNTTTFITNNYTNIVSTNINIVAALETGYTLSPTYTSVNSNIYSLDMGQTNSYGQNCIYADLLATNNIYLTGPVNPDQFKLLSVTVQASGVNSTIFIPQFSPFNTNGWTAGASTYYRTLTNGNQIILTLKTNKYLTVIWNTIGQ